MVEQVRFRIVNTDVGDTNEVLGGIAIYEDDTHLINVICGCCGGTLEPDDVEIIEVYEDDWVNLSEKILGYDRD